MASVIDLPNRLPVLKLSNAILFPSIQARLPIQGKNNCNVIEYCVNDTSALRNCVLAVAFSDKQSKNEENESADPSVDLYDHGVAVLVKQVVGTNWPRPSYTIHVSILSRLKFDKFYRLSPFMLARVTQTDRLPGSIISSAQFTEDQHSFVDSVSNIVQRFSNRNALINQLKSVLHNGCLDVITDLCAALIGDLSWEAKLNLISVADAAERMLILLPHIKKFETEMDEMKDDNEKPSRIELPPSTLNPDELQTLLKRITGTALDRTQNNNKIVKKNSNEELLQKLKAAKMPKSVESDVLSTYETYKKNQNDMGNLRGYLELMSELPWEKESTDTLNIEKARLDLDSDHFGLEDVKKRLIEFLAVRKLRENIRGPILCLIGPPGVGKTSVANSIAKTMNRKFQRVSLGGISDESEVRGHRRTYIGAMPGRIIQAIRRAGTRNPVILLDEIDKLSASGFHGDPRAALLEALDPEQNSHFFDHYVNHPFDLSKVLFLATANVAVTIPPALKDRLEIVDIAGYTADEKVLIANEHLWPKQLNLHGLCDTDIHIHND